jgi:hypothetical protein
MSEEVEERQILEKEMGYQGHREVVSLCYK